MKKHPLSLLTLSALVLLGTNPIRAEEITPEIKTVSQLRQETKVSHLLLSQGTIPPAIAQAVEIDEIDITVTGTRTPANYWIALVPLPSFSEKTSNST